MKKILLVLTALACITCSKDGKDENQTCWEVANIGDSPTINGSIQNIDFVFCLLNEEGTPTTTFKEGESFSFYFSSTNRRNEDLYINPVDFIVLNFCRVYGIDEKDYGRPFQSAIITPYIGAQNLSFEKGKSYIFEVPWVDDRDEWPWSYVTFRSSHQDFLSSGNYYTEFECNLSFGRIDKPSLDIGPLKFKINFTIE